ncbi:MAG: hypothetical protein AB1Z67_03570 [Candidatus Limnocylindrales bacterium]
MTGDQPGSAADPRPGTHVAVWLALFVALLLVLQTGTPPRAFVLAAIIIAATLAYSLHWRLSAGAIVVLLLVGVTLRLVASSGFSDVLMVTEAAIREMLAGGDPYGRGYDVSVPPGAPFAYGPLALLWYRPSLDDPGRMELLASLLVLGLLAFRGRPLGLAVYAVTPAIVNAAGDGSNDTTAGLLILVALLAAVRLPLLGAVLLALAVAFKPYALAWMPGLIGLAGVGPLLAFLAASAVFWLPAVAIWGSGSLLWSFREAEAVHENPYYSLAYGLGSGGDVPQPLWGILRLWAGLALALLNLLLVRSAAGLIIGGTLVFAATLFLGWWSTLAYLSAVAPIICWHLDDWLGLGGRVAWPGDPVRRVTTWADMAIPVRGSVMGSRAPAR